MTLPSLAPAATGLSPELGSKFANLALAHLTREYPNKLDHILNGPGDLKSPRRLHPLFFGSFDWHSNVHGYWLLATIYRCCPMLRSERARIRDLFDAQITVANVDAEREYLEQPLRATFERPYGWAWLLMLAAELARHHSEEGRKWSRILRPLDDEFVRRFRRFLPKATYPIRVGTHFNTAFALSLAIEYADTVHDMDFGDLLRKKASEWYANDRDCQAWEPSLDDFLSSALIEAECMRRVLDAEAWSDWMRAFLPFISVEDPPSLFTPVTVSDRADAKISHLDGLNLSRAWCWRSIASNWDDSDSRRAIALKAAECHLAASLPHVAGEYVGEHWLATFALLALLA
ncbi:MAG TPA: DUF2891 domain-containing protein [Gemmatimonadaceae bacterium]